MKMISLFVASCISIMVAVCAHVQARAQEPSPDIGWLDHWRLSTMSFGIC